jgi:hypothetical protein
MLVDVLNRSFRRVEQGAVPSMNNYNAAHIVPALLAYSRQFAENAVLAGVLAAEIAEMHEAFHAMRSQQDGFSQSIVVALDELLQLIACASHSDGVYQYISADALAEYRAHPTLEDLQESLRRLFQSASCLVATEDRGRLVALVGVYQKARKQYGDVEARYDFLCSGKSWLGAEMVDAFAHSPERQADVRVARAQMMTIKSIKSNLARDSSEEERWHMVDSMSSLLLHVGVFHDRVVSRLLAEREVEMVIGRFAERVERFEREEYLSVVNLDGKGGNVDERRLVRRLCVYLHDQGLMPYSEVETGKSRADTVAFGKGSGVARVAVEAKCIRSADTRYTIQSRVRTGAAQALSYARAHGLDVGHLVLYWASEMEPRISLEWASYRPSVSIVLVDLRGAPSKRAKGPIAIDLVPSETDIPASDGQ